jgi:hypothetical protein
MEGYRDGYEARRKLDQEKGEQACKKGLLEGYELGIQEGKDHERQKWLTEGHGAGLCLSMAAHARALFRGTVILEEAETQTDAVTTTSVDTQTTPAVTTTVNASTQAAPTTAETTSQTNSTPERRCAALQTEPPDDESPTLTKNAETTPHVDLNVRTTPRTTETATQTFVKPSSPPLDATTSLLTTPAQPPPTSSTTATTTASPPPKLPPAPQKRRHSLPGPSTTAQPSPKPPVSCPEPPVASTTITFDNGGNPCHNPLRNDC